MCLTLKQDTLKEDFKIQHKYYKLIWDQKLKFLYKDNLKWSPSVKLNVETDTIKELQNGFSQTFTLTAENLGMKQESCTRNSSLNEPWVDKECKDLKKVANQKLRYYRKNNFKNSDRKEYNIAVKEYKKMIEQKREQYLKNLTVKVNNAKNSQEFWKALSEFWFKPAQIPEITG